MSLAPGGAHDLAETAQAEASGRRRRISWPRAWRQPLTVVNGLKNVAVLAANVAGTLVFIAFGPVDWAIAGLVAAGSFAGGWLGAHVGRRLPGPVFRALVVLTGYVVGLRLLLT